jgi:hypothetical protein
MPLAHLKMADSSAILPTALAKLPGLLENGT